MPELPVEDMAAMERLWRDASDKKFGFVAQRKIFNSKKINRDLESSTGRFLFLYVVRHAC